MMTDTVVRDERIEAIENRGYRVAYGVLSFGLLILIGVRTWVRQDSNWDLFALLIFSGAVQAFYQGRQRAMPQGWWKAAIMVAVVGCVVGMVVTLFVASYLAGKR